MDTRIDPAKVARFLGAWRSQTLPDYRALAHGLTSLIDGSLLPAAHVLPSQRRLASALGVARGTVVRAYGILHESGRLEPRRGSGNYVARPRAVGSDIDGRLLSFADRSPAVDLSSGALPGDELVAEAIGAVGPMLSGDRLASPGYSPSGLPELRSLIAERHTNAGLATSPEQILVTAGAQQAVWLIANALAGPGTLTLLEDPTYRGALEAFAGAGGRVRGVPFDNGHLDLEALRDGVRGAAVLYVQSPIHNPTGLHYPSRHRRAIGEIAERCPAIVVDDHSQADLPWFRSSPAPGMEAFADPDRLLTIATLSKLFWGGLRIGWIRGPSPLIRQLGTLKSAADLGAAVPDQLAATLLLPHSRTQLRKRRAVLLARYTEAAATVREIFPSWTWDQPAGGTGMWVDTRGDATILEQRAARAGIRLAPGRLFSRTGRWNRHLRLPVWPKRETMAEALRTVRSGLEPSASAHRPR